MLQSTDGTDREFEFNDQVCGTWLGVASTPLLCVMFRGGGRSDNQPPILHVFAPKPNREHNYELLPITDKVYDEVSLAFPKAVQHYNADTDRVELIRIFDD